MLRSCSELKSALDAYEQSIRLLKKAENGADIDAETMHRWQAEVDGASSKLYEVARQEFGLVFEYCSEA